VNGRIQIPTTIIKARTVFWG